MRKVLNQIVLILYLKMMICLEIINLIIAMVLIIYLITFDDGDSFDSGFDKGFGNDGWGNRKKRRVL